ncbi:MAG: hypothetical protein CMJ78_21590 [Planctomycetaceae bacterium]|nr:hypothetical protein [Planctomycetaceae bacterium]
MTPDENSQREEQLNQLIAELITKWEQGEVIDLEAFQTEHSEFASELEEFIGDFYLFNDVAEPFQDLQPENREIVLEVVDFIDDDETADLAQTKSIGESELPDSETSMPERIRYFGDFELIEEIARVGSEEALARDRVDVSKLYLATGNEHRLQLASHRQTRNAATQRKDQRADLGVHNKSRSTQLRIIGRHRPTRTASDRG